jgi:hypothetical protein
VSPALVGALGVVGLGIALVNAGKGPKLLQKQ